MRQALPLALAALLLSGCASHKPEDFNGTWINQDAIKAAVKGGSLRQALNEHGPVFEWKLEWPLSRPASATASRLPMAS